MTIREAIAEAKARGEWCIVPDEPNTVIVEFMSKLGYTDETELELYSNYPELELMELWGTLCGELGARRNSVTYVGANDYSD